MGKSWTLSFPTSFFLASLSHHISYLILVPFIQVLKHILLFSISPAEAADLNVVALLVFICDLQVGLSVVIQKHDFVYSTVLIRQYCLLTFISLVKDSPNLSSISICSKPSNCLFLGMSVLAQHLKYARWIQTLFQPCNSLLHVLRYMESHNELN